MSKVWIIQILYYHSIKIKLKMRQFGIIPPGRRMLRLGLYTQRVRRRERERRKCERAPGIQAERDMPSTWTAYSYRIRLGNMRPTNVCNTHCEWAEEARNHSCAGHFWKFFLFFTRVEGEIDHNSQLFVGK